MAELKLTVVIFRRRETDPFEARVLQEYRLGPNLSPKTGTAAMSRSAAERRLRHDGFMGVIEFQEGLPEAIRALPVDASPVPAQRGLRQAKISTTQDLF